MNEVTRMHYYNGLFLKEEDFTTEQNYNIRMRRLMNWYLNRVYGILEGLDVEPLEGKKYRITPGIAISNSGQDKWYATEIVLTSDAEADFSEKTPGDYYITITYDEAKGDDDASKGSDKIHWIERPNTDIKSKLPDSPEKDIVLAKITVPAGDWGSDSKYVNTNDRKEIGPALRSINDKVGIGTPTPSEKLEVNGTVKAVKFVGNGSGLTSVKAGQWTDIPGGISYNAGNVGIGTLSPDKNNKLQVEGNLHMNGNSIFLRVNPTDQFDVIQWNSTKDQIDIGGFNGVNLCYTQGAAKPVLTPVLSVGATGNVGIGTTAPQYKLHVEGTGLFGGGNANLDPAVGRVSLNPLEKSGKLLIGWNRSGGGGETDFIANRDGGSFGGFMFYDYADGGALTNLVTILGNGNVGIGTLTPSQKLEVTGNVKISGTIIQEDWIAANFLNGWVNYDSGYNPAGYFLDKNGIVHLRGLVKNGGMNASIFNLPMGYRPLYRELFTVTSANGASRCDISTTGEVIPMTGGNGFFSLDGITFRAKQEFIFIPPIVPPVIIR